MSLAQTGPTNEDIAIAFVTTSRSWAGRWGRYMRDHGPVTVVDQIAEVQTAFDHPWRVVVADATSWMADAQFVALVHDRGRGVIAVWDPLEPAGKQRAVEAGVDDLVEVEADAVELAQKVRALAETYPAQRPRTERGRRRPLVASAPRRTGQLVVVGGPHGAGTDQVALALGRAFGRRGEATVVVDANDVCPSLAQLVDAAATPNIASAAVAARSGEDVVEHLQVIDRFYLLAGFGEPGQWAEFTPSVLRSLVAGLATRFARTVVVVGPLLENLSRYGDRFAIARALLAEADTVVGVGVANPTGMTWLTTWVADARSVTQAPLFLAAADAPGDRFRRAEVLERLRSMGAPADVALLPNDDNRVQRAAWNGRAVRRGPLVRSVANLAATIGPCRKKAEQ